AFADVLLLPAGGLDLLADRLAVRLEGLEDLAQHLLGFPDDVFSRAGPGRDGRHVGFQVGGHLGLRDPLRVILQGLDHGASTRRRAWILPLDELAVVQLLDDLVPRRLRPESDPFHFLDEGPFAVPGRRFRAILADRYGTDAVQGFARRESRKDRLSDGPIRIVFPPSRILDPVTLGKEELASEIDLRFRRLGDGIRGDRGEEAPHDELVNGPMVVPLHLFSRDPLDRVDRRVVRRLGTASTRHDPLLRGEGPRLFRKGRILEFLEDRTEVHAGRIDRIVRARIRDVPRLVQILRDLHRLSRAKTDAVGLGDEHRRIERRGRTLFSLVLNVLADESLRRTLGQLEGGLRLRARPPHADFGSDLLDQAEGLDADQFPFAVEVRRDDNLVRVRGKLLQRGTDLPRGHDLLRFRPHEFLQVDAGPVVQGLRIIQVDDVPTKADDPDAVLALAELEDGGALHVRPLRLPVAEDGRDADRSVELLCHN